MELENVKINQTLTMNLTRLLKISFLNQKKKKIISINHICIHNLLAIEQSPTVWDHNAPPPFQWWWHAGRSVMLCCHHCPNCRCLDSLASIGHQRHWVWVMVHSMMWDNDSWAAPAGVMVFVKHSSPNTMRTLMNPMSDDVPCYFFTYLKFSFFSDFNFDWFLERVCLVVFFFCFLCGC